MMLKVAFPLDLFEFLKRPHWVQELVQRATKDEDSPSGFCLTAWNSPLLTRRSSPSADQDGTDSSNAFFLENIYVLHTHR